MPNPWTRNPWLSMWLSAANQWSGAVQGAMQSAMRRQVASTPADAMRQMVEFWTPQAQAARFDTTLRSSRRR